MTKIQKLFSILILLFLTGACAAGEGGGHGSSAPVATLDRAQWPTEVPAVAQPTATAFPAADTSIQEALAEQEAARQVARARAAQETEEETSAENALPSTATPVPPTATPEPTSSPTAEPTEVASQQQDEAIPAIVNSFGLNLRSGPGANFSILQELRQGDAVTIVGTDEGSSWVNVEAGDLVGWVNAAFLTFDGDLADVQGSQTVAASSAIGQSSGTASGGRLLVQLQAGGDIMVVNRDGSGLRKITSGIDPVLSPDGNKIAFTRWDSANLGSLWVANTDGSGEAMIVGGIKQAKSPSWSPDSKRIAINFQEGGQLEDVQICRSLFGPRPDINFWVAYNIQIRGFNICWRLPPDPHWRLRLVELATGDFKDLPSGRYAFAPTWDPANDWRVVSADQFGLVWTDVNRGVSEALTTDPSDRAPTFSPQGQYLAVTYKQHLHWEVHRINADGTGRVRLTKTPLYAVAEGTPVSNNASPVFSPDTAEIAFLTDRTGRWEVWVMNNDGSNQRPMFSDAINDQLDIFYSGNDARMLGWGS